MEEAGAGGEGHKGQREEREQREEKEQRGQKKEEKQKEQEEGISCVAGAEDGEDLALSDDSALEARSYQTEAYRAGMQGNVVVVMQTGLGKTRVACMLADYFLHKSPEQCVVVVVPKVAMLHGSSDPIVEGTWQQLMSAYKIVVVIHDILKKSLDNGLVSLHDFSLVVFDECHHTTGNGAMAQIARHIQREPLVTAPRVLGLTATHVNGREDVWQRKDELEALLRARFCCPEIPPQFLKERSRHLVAFSPAAADPVAAQRVMGLAVTLLNAFEEHFGPRLEIRDSQKVGKHALQLLGDLGAECAECYLFEGVARQERRIAEKLLELRPDEDTTDEQRKKILSLQANAQSFLNVFPSVQQLFRDDAARVALLTPSSPLSRTDKLSKLLALLHSVAKAKGREGLHCILFVERIVTAFALADAINREFKGSPTLSWLTAQAVAGSKGMSHREQQEVVARFSAGAIPLLVATATLYEGVDVAHCNVAIRFDKFSTTRSYVQAEVRARANGAVIYYFENDYEEEERKSQAVTMAARSASSQPSTSSSSTSSPDTMAAFRHPYHHGSEDVGQITIHNCMSILVEYAQKATKLEIRPAENMFQGGELATGLDIPTPGGVLRFDLAELGNFWGETAIETLQPPLSKKINGADKIRLQFAFLACVHLAQQGWLNHHNSPSEECLRVCPIACAGWPLHHGPERRRLKPAFSPTVEPEPGMQGCELCSISNFNSADQRNAHLEGKTHRRRKERESLAAGPKSEGCKLCGINTFNAKDQWTAHMEGAQHKKREQKQSVRDIVLEGCSLCEIETFSSMGQRMAHLAGAQHKKQEQKQSVRGIVLEGCALCDIETFSSIGMRTAHLGGAQHKKQELADVNGVGIELQGCSLCEIDTFTSANQRTEHLAGTQHWKKDRQKLAASP